MLETQIVMQDLEYRMLRYMQAEELAESTKEIYSRTYRKLKFDVGNIENRGTQFWIEYLANISDPIYRNNIRSVILKVCRDVLGENLKLPIVKRPVRLQEVYTIDEVCNIFSAIKNVLLSLHRCSRSLMQLLFTFKINLCCNSLLRDCVEQHGRGILLL